MIFIFIFGTGLYGRVYRVPGLFYVATQFAHFWYMPIFPVRTLVILEGMETEDRVTGKTVRASVSVLAGYIRWWFGLFAMGMAVVLASAVVSITRYNGAQEELAYTEFGVCLAILLGGCLFVMVAPLRGFQFNSPVSLLIFVQVLTHLTAIVILVSWLGIREKPQMDIYPPDPGYILFVGLIFNAALFAIGAFRFTDFASLPRALELGHVLGVNPKLIEARLEGRHGPLLEEEWELVE